VLATASTTSRGTGLTGRADAGQFERRHVVAVWTVWAWGCVAVMFVLPGAETIPYHLGWAGFALAFGLSTWSQVQLVTALACYTLATGVALERSWLLGRIGWDETTEIPLMFLLTLLMVWHVRRRQSALGHVTRMAEREGRAFLDREQLMRLTSHELRTPLTIARGYVELLQTRAVGLENQQDLAVVADEIERLSRVSERLVRVIRLQDDTTSEIYDIDEVMAQAVERWRVVEDRRWVLEVGAGRIVGSPERMRTVIDTLVENAIRYTSVGDTIRLTGIRQVEHVLVGVSDSGLGLTDEQSIAINTGADLQPSGVTAAGASETFPGLDLRDSLQGTGLGLSIVRALAHARGGSLQAAHAPEGGAAMVITLPVRVPSQAGPLISRVVDDPPSLLTLPTERYAAAMVVVPDVT
jgi:two-component system OmpR family sensor kinase